MNKKETKTKNRKQFCLDCEQLNKKTIKQLFRFGLVASSESTKEKVNAKELQSIYDRLPIPFDSKWLLRYCDSSYSIVPYLCESCNKTSFYVFKGCWEEEDIVHYWRRFNSRKEALIVYNDVKGGQNVQSAILTFKVPSSVFDTPIFNTEPQCNDLDIDTKCYSGESRA